VTSALEVIFNEMRYINLHFTYLLTYLPNRPPTYRENQGSEKNRFFKKPNPPEFLGFIGFWALLGFWSFYLNEQFGSLLAGLAHHLSFYVDSPAL